MRSALALLLVGYLLGGSGDTALGVDGLTATGHDSRIDLQWQPAPDRRLAGYDVYRSETDIGPFAKLNAGPHETHVFSDFIGVNDKTFFYRVIEADSAGREGSEPVVKASPTAMSDDELLTSVQEATFRYFWDFAHPVSGLAYDKRRPGRLPDPYRNDACTIGGTGFGLMAIAVGADRRFVTRHEAAARVLKIVTFLQEKAERFHGVWPHWLDGRSGRTIPFGGRYSDDDGADLVETSLLVQGLLTVRRYFDREDPVEDEIRRRSTQLWHEVQWDWFLKEPGGKTLYWHWSPAHGWKKNLAVVGYNECLITYLLAIASPTHPIPPECYHEGWGSNPHYTNGDEYYGYRQWVGRPLGGPLFFTHYSFLGFDPRGRRDRFCDYFENNRNTALIHRAYCTENPKGHQGYGPAVWGITSCCTPDGYRGLDPQRDGGTIAPTAAIGAMPYTPEASMAALRHYYHEFGHRLWSESGFLDALNLDRNWFADRYLAIDQGPIVIMIENYRTGLCWRLFMSNPEIEPMLDSIGWQKTAER